MAGIAFVATRDSAPEEKEISTISQPEATPSPTRGPDAQRAREAEEAEGRPLQGLRRRLQQLQRHRPGRPGRGAGQPDRLAGGRLRQLVRHHPGLDRLLPQAAGAGRQAAGPRPRHPAHRARGRPDAARPADRHPHRPSRLTRPRDARAVRVWWASGMEFTSAGASRSTPPWSEPPPRPSSGWTSTAPWPRSSRTRPQAHIHPDAGAVLVALAEQVLAVAVVTGRPARQALDLGGLEQVGNAIGDAGKELYLFGQYGNERWSSTNRRVISPAAAARAGVVHRRPAAAAAPARAPRTRTSRRRGWRSPCTPAGWPTPTRPSRRCCRRSRAGRPLRPRGRAREAGDRGALARHAQGARGRAAGRGARRRRLRLRRRRPRRHRGVRGGGRRWPRAACPPCWSARPPTRRAPWSELSDVLVHGPEGVLDLLRQLTDGCGRAASLTTSRPHRQVEIRAIVPRDTAEPATMAK